MPKLCGFCADTCVASCRYLRRTMQVSAQDDADTCVFGGCFILTYGATRKLRLLNQWQ